MGQPIPRQFGTLLAEEARSHMTDQGLNSGPVSLENKHVSSACMGLLAQDSDGIEY